MMRVGSFSLITLVVYLVLIVNLERNVSGMRLYGLIAMISVCYLLILVILGLREKNLSSIYHMKRRIESGNKEFLLCPNCKVIQLKGNDHCLNCKEEWIICRSCKVPFEAKSKILISPCCGQGFHFEHFEADLREFGHCPYCNSDLALKTANW